MDVIEVKEHVVTGRAAHILREMEAEFDRLTAVANSLTVPLLAGSHQL